MTESSLTDEFYKKLRANDAQAMAQAVKQELPRVYNLCIRLCRNSVEAEDLCQDVFVRALKGFAHFDGKARLSTWLYTVTLNTWKNKLRSEKRRRRESHVSIDESNEFGDSGQPYQLADPSLKPDQIIESKELSGRVYLALDRLDEQSRSIIILKDVEHLPYEQIGQIMKIPLGTVKSKLSRAREELRHVWKSLS